MTQYTVNPPTDANEEWRVIPDLGGKYLMSSQGRVFTRKHKRIMPGFMCNGVTVFDFWINGVKVKRIAGHKLFRQMFPELNPPKQIQKRPYVPQTTKTVFEPDLPGEEWRSVVGFEEIYQISNKGRLKRIRASKRYPAGRISLLKPSHTGYADVKLYDDNQHEHRTAIHRLVMGAFVGPANGLDVNHIDGNKSNNNLENLEYVTRRENMLHATHVLKTLTHDHVKGENCKHAKLTQRQVDMIRDLYALGTYTHKDLADAFYVALPNIAAIINGRSWKDSMASR